MAQYSRPDSGNTWTPVGAATCWEAIDEVVFNDGDYCQQAGLGAQTITFGMSDVLDPTINTSHFLRVRALVLNDNPGTATLKCGLNTVCTLPIVNTPAWTTYEWPLSEVEAAIITDYTDLTVTIDINLSVGGFPGLIAVSWLELEVIDVPTFEMASGTIAATSYVGLVPIEVGISWVEFEVPSDFTFTEAEAFASGSIGATSTVSATASLNIPPGWGMSPWGLTCWGSCNVRNSVTINTGVNCNTVGNPRDGNIEFNITVVDPADSVILDSVIVTVNGTYLVNKSDPTYGYSVGNILFGNYVKFYPGFTVPKYTYYKEMKLPESSPANYSTRVKEISPATKEGNFLPEYFGMAKVFKPAGTGVAGGGLGYLSDSINLNQQNTDSLYVYKHVDSGSIVQQADRNKMTFSTPDPSDDVPLTSDQKAAQQDYYDSASQTDKKNFYWETSVPTQQEAYTPDSGVVWEEGIPAGTPAETPSSTSSIEGTGPGGIPAGAGLVVSSTSFVDFAYGYPDSGGYSSGSGDSPDIPSYLQDYLVYQSSSFTSPWDGTVDHYGNGYEFTIPFPQTLPPNTEICITIYLETEFGREETVECCWTTEDIFSISVEVISLTKLLVRFSDQMSYSGSGVANNANWEIIPVGTGFIHDTNNIVQVKTVVPDSGRNPSFVILNTTTMVWNQRYQVRCKNLKDIYSRTVGAEALFLMRKTKVDHTLDNLPSVWSVDNTSNFFWILASFARTFEKIGGFIKDVDI